MRFICFSLYLLHINDSNTVFFFIKLFEIKLNGLYKKAGDKKMESFVNVNSNQVF